MIFLSNNLRYLRKKRRETQDETASGLNFKKTTYAGYETGHSKPGLEELIQLSEYFRVSIDDLLKADVSTLQNLPLITGKNIGFLKDTAADDTGTGVKQSAKSTPNPTPKPSFIQKSGNYLLIDEAENILAELERDYQIKPQKLNIGTDSAIEYLNLRITQLSLILKDVCRAVYGENGDKKAVDPKDVL